MFSKLGKWFWFHGHVLPNVVKILLCSNAHTPIAVKIMLLIPGIQLNFFDQTNYQQWSIVLLSRKKGPLLNIGWK